ncbi:MAG: FAD-dependent oxidoreductase [Kiritimatiellia bacterium]
MSVSSPALLTRRTFFGAAAAAGACGYAPATAAARNGFAEPSRTLPVDAWADVIVCGGGPAGVAAAVNAARAGRKVRLFELQGGLGGVWTSGLLTYIFDFDKSETDREIMLRLDAYGARNVDRPAPAEMACYRGGLNRDWVYEPAYMKRVCEDMCVEAGVRIHLHTPVVAAYRDAAGRNVDVVVTESKSGRQAWRAKTFIDCSGDGDLGALSGCGFDLGWTPDGFGQPATLNALVTVGNGEAIKDFVSNEPAMWTRVPQANGKTTCHHIFASHKLRDLLRAQGLSPSYGDPTLFRCRGNLFCFMATHAYKLRLDDAAAVSAATIRARQEIFRLADALARLGGAWEGFRVVCTAEQIGHRDARRIHGRYTVTRADVAAGRRFADAVTESRFGIDIHGLDQKANDVKAAGQDFGATFRPFQIPLRACQARDVDNLYMAGRCISGDFIAHASYRVTGSSVAQGEAVGRAAARAAGEGSHG